MLRSFSKLFSIILALSALLLFLGQAPLAAQSGSPFFYYYDGVQIPLTLNPASIVVRFNPQATDSVRRSVVDGTGDLGVYQARVDEQPLSLSFLPVNPGHDPLSAIGKLNQRSEVQTAGRVFQFQDGSQFAETEEFVVRFKKGLSAPEIEAFNLANTVELVRSQEFSDRVLILRAASGNKRSALDLANAYARSGLVEFAEPNFVLVQPVDHLSPATLAPKAPATPNDPDFTSQWSLRNTGQYPGASPGADINAVPAWGVTTGSSSIEIAIIDEGVDSTQPDLGGGKVLGGYCSIPGCSTIQPNAGDKHGTAVAEIAAATANNGFGISGVCPACRILPVRVAFEDTSHNWVTTVSQLSAGIDWAWSNGADVLSNSWTMIAPSNDVANSIANARFGGRIRGGVTYGSTIVFSTGNQNKNNVNTGTCTNTGGNTVSFPACLNFVVAVGASNWCDQRKTMTNDLCNDQNASWGSNFGNALDVLAPGEAILTCDGGSCFSFFSGTSASAPMVAGIVGLLYSLNPNLQPQDVQNALQVGAKDLPPAGFDIQTGYGRVDAYRSIASLYNLGITMVGNNPLVHPGDQVQFALTYSNNGKTAMGGTVVQVSLPPGLSFVNSNPVFTPSGGGIYQFNAGTLQKSTNGSATLTAQAQPGTEGAALAVTAQIAGAFPELNMSDNTSRVTVGVISTNLFLPFMIR